MLFLGRRNRMVIDEQEAKWNGRAKQRAECKGEVRNGIEGGTTKT